MSSGTVGWLEQCCSGSQGEPHHSSGKPETYLLWEPWAMYFRAKARCLILKVVCHPSLPRPLGFRKSRGTQFGEKSWFELWLAAQGGETAETAGQRQARFWSEKAVSVLRLTPCVFFIWSGQHFPPVLPPTQGSSLCAHGHLHASLLSPALPLPQPVPWHAWSNLPLRSGVIQMQGRRWFMT